MPKRRLATLALAALLPALAPARAAEPLPVDAAVASQARTVRSLPCAGGTTVDGFAPDPGAPAAWRVAGALVSVRRRGGDRIAFVLDPPKSGSADCTVRDAIVLPRGGQVLACELQDGSVRGLGVHALMAGGGRDVVFWRGDGAGGLRPRRAGDEAYESDTGQLICTPPDPIP